MSTKSPDWMIDEAGKDSFPASDPPAWGSSRAAPSQASVEAVEDQVTGKVKRYRSPVLLGVLGLIALSGLVIGIRYVRNR